MSRTSAFQWMLQQMAVHFYITDVIKCIFAWQSGKHRGFMLHMANGEYWYLTNLASTNAHFNEATPVGVFEIYKFPPPIPAVSEIRPWPTEAVALDWNPRDLSDYIKEMDGAESLFLQRKDD